MPDNEYIVGMFGKDQTGTLADVAQRIFDDGGNLGKCQSLRMRGFQGVILEVSTPLTRKKLRERLLTLAKQHDLPLEVQVEFAVREEVTQPGVQQYDICVWGEERRGFVASVAELLARHKLNISGLDAGVAGERTYVMQVRVELPETSSKAEVETALRDELHKLPAEIRAMEPASATLIGSIAQIKDVRLKQSLFHLEGTVVDADTLSYGTGYFAEPRPQHGTMLCVDVGFGLLQDGDGAEVASQTLKASAVFELEYDLPHLQDYLPQELQKFADTNAILTALPYWRQLVHSMLPSMGVHKVIIPAFPVPSAAVYSSRFA